MIQYEVFVRAKTSDDRWASVHAIELDERSFRLLVMEGLSRLGAFASLVADEDKYELRTPLTKAQAEGED